MATIRYGDNSVQNIITSPLTLTTSWADTGSAIDTRDLSSVLFWFKFTINNSLNLRFRMVGSDTESFTDTYLLPIESVAPGLVTILPEFYEFDSDTDTNMIYQTNIVELVPYVKLQVQVETLGAVPAVIDSLKISMNTARQKK